MDGLEIEVKWLFFSLSAGRTTSRPDISERSTLPRPTTRFNVDDMFDDDLKTARRRAEKAITEDGFLDVKDIRFPKKFIADEFDEEVTLGRPEVCMSYKLLKSSSPLSA